MSTLPRDPVDAAPAGAQATVLPARRDLEQAVREFGVAAERLGTSRPVAEELNDLCHHVAAFTAELFPGEMRVQIKNDPEIPERSVLPVRR